MLNALKILMYVIMSIVLLFVYIGMHYYIVCLAIMNVVAGFLGSPQM